MKKDIINPIGLKGKEVLSRMKELMGESIDRTEKNYVIELTKKGPDDKIYAIVRENHQYFIKFTNKTENVLAEDFKYMGGLQNKPECAFPSYAKAIKQLNLKFINLAEAYGVTYNTDTFLNDNLISENSVFADEDKMKEAVETHDDDVVEEAIEDDGDNDADDIRIEHRTIKISAAINESPEGFKKKTLNNTEIRISSAILKAIEKVNKYISIAKEYDVLGIEPNGTWEEMYEFFPITLVGRFLYINYKEPYNQNKDYRERFNVVDPETKQDLSYMLSWIIKSIKKGFKEEGKIDVLKFRLNQGVDESAIVETKFKLKLKDNTPPATSPAPAQPTPELMNQKSMDAPEEPSNDNGTPFEKEPFDAGVETNEDEDPKKFIEQLSGKLGQSLRKYTEGQGQPDFKLEKFAINSVISATHTSEMPEEDKNDIIKKINSAGNDDENQNNQPNNNQETNGNSEEFGGDEKNFDESLHMSENFSNFAEKKDMNTCENCTIDEIIDELTAEPTTKPIVKPDVKPDVKPSRRGRPFVAPIIEPGTEPAPKATVTESIIEIKPEKIWWENDANELLRIAYWNKNQIPPVDLDKKREAFVKISDALNKKYQAPEGRVAQMINNIK